MYRMQAARLRGNRRTGQAGVTAGAKQASKRRRAPWRSSTVQSARNALDGEEDVGVVAHEQQGGLADDHLVAQLREERHDAREARLRGRTGGTTWPGLQGLRLAARPLGRTARPAGRAPPHQPRELEPRQAGQRRLRDAAAERAAEDEVEGQEAEHVGPDAAAAEGGRGTAERHQGPSGWPSQAHAHAWQRAPLRTCAHSGGRCPGRTCASGRCARPCRTGRT